MGNDPCKKFSPGVQPTTGEFNQTLIGWRGLLFNYITLPSMTTKDCNNLILDIVSQEQPVRARYIADILKSKYKIDISRTDVNSRLYGALGRDVIRNEFFQWSIWKGETSKPPRYVRPEEHDDQDAINLDSTVKVRYPNGQEVLVGFSLYESLRFAPQKNDITYIYCKSPIARALLGKKAGLAGSVRGFSFQILQVD